jgi:CheY-like chemotaxis protein
MTTILVVDDSPIDRMIAGSFVEEAGHAAAFAANGLEALAYLEKNAPDIVLTDLRMPEMDGLELVREMRAKHPGVPVILMTGFGSEDTAVAALRAGAANYVPKTDLRSDLEPAVRVVLDTMRPSKHRERVRDFLRTQDTYYVVGYEEGATRALVSHLQEDLRLLHLCRESDLIRVGTALTEALANALHHGNLELDSSLRERADGEYWKLAKEREQIAPFRDRRVHVQVRLTQTQATFVVRDEGHGFDVAALPDPRDPENITKASGRGVMLIRTFMDEVRYNEAGNEITMVMTPGRGEL